MHEIHYVSLGVNLVNVIILALLTRVYVRNYRYIRSDYNLGLLIFSLLFIIENAIAAHLAIFSWPGFEADPIILHMVVINIIQLLGLLALLRITWK
jgi:hypothetical protein